MSYVATAPLRPRAYGDIEAGTMGTGMMLLWLGILGVGVLIFRGALRPAKRSG